MIRNKVKIGRLIFWIFDLLFKKDTQLLRNTFKTKKSRKSWLFFSEKLLCFWGLIQRKDFSLLSSSHIYQRSVLSYC